MADDAARGSTFRARPRLDDLVGQLALATDDFSTLPEIATRGVGDLLHGTSVLWVLDTDVQTIRLVAGWHPEQARRLDLAELGDGVEMQRGQGFLGQLLEHGATFYRPQLEPSDLVGVNPAYLEYFARHGLTGMIIVPLSARGQQIGMLGVSRHASQEPFVDDDLALMRQVAGHVALAVDNSRLLALARVEIADRRNSERRLRHQATHDSLTDLPNRALLRERLDGVTGTRADIGIDSGLRALLILDLDGFKDVNDGLGHEAGDAVLRQIAGRLQGGIPPGAFLARLGGDEFAVLVDDTGPSAFELATDLRALLANPAWAGGQPVHLGGSVGIAFVWPTDEPADLMRRADLAMYRAKQTGEGVCVFDEVVDGPQAERLTRLGALRRAIANGELRLHWQPIVDVRTREVVLAEGLVRWQQGDRLVPPGEFVPLAEQSGLIVPLTYWVVETAATDYAHWAAQGRPFPISINLATPVLAEVGVADQLKARFAVEGVPCHEVTLEISESGLLNQRARDGVSACAAAGFRLAIDDFGTGYASFSYLKDVDVDVVKIDRSFVRNLHTDERDVAIVGSIAFVTRRLGLRTVAEGVESEQALELLDELGIDEAQGFLFSPALPVDDLDLWRAGWTGSQQAHRQPRGVSQPESRQ
ncbi:MAG: hypothetical protein QOJ32_3007 [Frankiaceae bacterium]|nr:hypothetical protein [Frankiaceae bacterium]